MLDTRTRYLGTRPVKLFRVRSQNKDAVKIIISSTFIKFLLGVMCVFSFLASLSLPEQIPFNPAKL